MDLLKKYSSLVLIIFLGGCSKEPTPQLVTGDWRWEQSYSFGCFSNYKSKPKIGETVLLKFTPTGIYSITRNDTLRMSGTYRLSKEKNEETGKYETQIIFDGKAAKDSTTYDFPYVAGALTIDKMDVNQLAIGRSIGTGSYGHTFVR